MYAQTLLSTIEHQESSPMKRSRNGEPGHGIVEYALILVLALVIVIIALVLAGPSLEEFFNSLLGELAPS